MNETTTIGEILNIKLKNGSAKTKLQEFLSDDEFAVFQPVYNGLPLWPAHDEVLPFCFFRDDGVYQFNAKITDTYEKDGLHLCSFRQVSEIVKQQRREAYRLPVVLDVTIQLEDEEQAEEKKIRVYKAKSVNLSEKGIELTCFSRLPENTKVILTVFFGNIAFDLHAEIIKCTKPEKKTDPYDIVLLFVGCIGRDITYIRKYILHKQIQAKAIKEELKEDEN